MNKEPFHTRPSKEKRLILASLVAALFLALTPAPARAGCCATNVISDISSAAAVGAMDTAIADILALTNGILATIFANLTYLTNITMPTVSAAITTSLNSHGMMTDNVTSMHGDFVSGNYQFVRNQANMARFQSEASMPNQTTSCGVQRWMQASEQMYTNSRAIGGAHTALVMLGDCRGKNANCSSAARVKEEFYDLCYLGFLPPNKYGDMLGDLGCKTPETYESDQSYYDRHLNLDLFINTIQMPIAKPCILPDKFPYFSVTLPPGMPASFGCIDPNSMADPPALIAPPTVWPKYNQDPAQSELAWVASYKFCDLLGSAGKTPIFTQSHRAVNVVDLRKVMEDQRISASNVNGAKNLCFFYLWERTAFPAPTDGSPVQAGAVDGTTDAAQDQQAVCDAMWTPPNPDGADPAGSKLVLEGTGDGTPTYPTDTGLGIQSDYYLASCSQNHTGMSPLMMRKVMNYRCADYNWLPRVWANAARDAGALERTAQFECTKMGESYQDYIKTEQRNLAEAINDAALAADEAGDTRTGMTSGDVPVGTGP